jgi:hypothetical protein
MNAARIGSIYLGEPRDLLGHPQLDSSTASHFQESVSLQAREHPLIIAPDPFTFRKQVITTEVCDDLQGRNTMDRSVQVNAHEQTETGAMVR